jgi:cation diffusion facilitator CzcD-associated flavoprotein CzcO
VLASGPLHFPKIPDIPGLSDFQGEVFHSARWNHDYDLTGKKVVSIGTGGSAIQYVPEIAPKVEKLHVMQRSPAWLIPRDMRTYSALSKFLFKYVPGMRWLHRARLYWSNESRVWPIFNPRLARALSKAARMFIKREVHDPEIQKKLTPDYTLGCKRILISNDYFPTFNRDNVELVTEGIQEIRAHSVVTKDGIEREADCIILGTGFEVDPRNYMRDFPVTGVGGRTIQQDWADGAEAYLGLAVHGYPNFFQLVGPNTGLGHNSIIFMIESQIHYILGCMDLLERQGAAFMDVKPDVQRSYNEMIQAQFPRTVWGTGCQSWYNQADGKNIAIWPFSTWRYWLRTRKVDPTDYEIGTPAEQQPAAQPASTPSRSEPAPQQA